MAKEIIAVDVSKKKLDIYYEVDDFFESIDNSEESILVWMQKLKLKTKALVIFEATAGYERLLADLLLEEKIQCVKCSGKRVRDFSKSQGQAKTDKLDAKMIAAYAKSSKLQLYKGLDEDHSKLKELSTRRRQLLDLINQEGNRQGYRYKTMAESSIESVLACLHDELENIEGAIDDLINESKSISEKIDILTSIPGVGRICAMTILSELPELGELGKAEVANLGGLAPQNYDSGQSRGHRFVNRSRSAIKKVLYMSAMSARTNNQKIRQFFERLKKKGKSGKLALVACMRKLLIYMNYMIKNKQSWSPN